MALDQQSDAFNGPIIDWPEKAISLLLATYPSALTGSFGFSSARGCLSPTVKAIQLDWHKFSTHSAKLSLLQDGMQAVRLTEPIKQCSCKRVEIDTSQDVHLACSDATEHRKEICFFMTTAFSITCFSLAISVQRSSHCSYHYGLLPASLGNW